MRIEGDSVIFSTGKEVFANNGIIGLSPPDKEGWCISEGYDGEIDHARLSRDECTELADFMIALWQQFKLDKIVRRSSFVIRKCSRCDCNIGTKDGSVYMKHGEMCIPCAETLGAFDRFKSDE